MLSIHRVNRDYHARRFEALLSAILEHRGLLVPSSLKLRLSGHPACALGLALQRVAELSFSPTNIQQEMLTELLDMQQPDGSIDHDPLPTACLAHALSHLFRDGMGYPGSPLQTKLHQAHEMAIQALAGMQSNAAGLEPWQLSADPVGVGFMFSEDRTVQERAAVASFVLMLLVHDPLFRELVDVNGLLNWFAEHRTLLEPATVKLWQTACLDLSTLTPPHRRRVQRQKVALAA